MARSPYLLYGEEEGTADHERCHREEEEEGEVATGHKPCGEHQRAQASPLTSGDDTRQGEGEPCLPVSTAAAASAAAVPE